MRRADLRMDQRGSAMVISLLVLMVLTALGAMFLVQTNTETQIAGNDQRWTQALFNAEAGYGEALARMADPNDAANYMGRPMDDWTANPGWGAYLVTAAGASAQDPDAALAETDGLDNDLDGSIDETDERYPEVMTKQVGSDIVEYSWVKVRYKLTNADEVMLFGNHDNDLTTPPQVNLAEGYPVLTVTSEGEKGTSNRTVEVEAVKHPFETVEAALYAEDDDFKFNGTAFRISGKDWDPVTETYLPLNDEVPGIVTTQNPDNIQMELRGNQINNVEGVGAEPSVLASDIDLDLEGMAVAYRPRASIRLAAGNYANQVWGTWDDYEVLHVAGDLHVAGQCTGAGLAIVDGSFFCSGQFIWYGLMLVLGDIVFTGGGSGIHIYGSVLVQGNIDEQVVGGEADILYSSEALARLAMMSPYVVSSWREP